MGFIDRIIRKRAGGLAFWFEALWSGLASNRLDAARDEWKGWERVVAQETEKKKKYRCCLFLHSGGYARVHEALSLANVVAASGGEAHILFSYGALKRLVRENIDRISIDGFSEPTDGYFESNVGAGRVPSLSELITYGVRLGGLKIYACSAAMAALNISRDELVDSVDQSTGLVGFLNLVKESDLTLYI